MRPFPVSGLPPRTAERLRQLAWGRPIESPGLEDLRSGRAPWVLCTGEDVPDPLPPGVRMTVLGVGDRREVLVEGAGTLADVPKDTRVGVSTARQRALLRAHHPRLVPVSQGRADGPVIRPLWPEPELEAHGEVLEWESWLPAPGQGIPVLLHTDSDTDIPSCPEAAAVLTGERALARRFPQVTTCVLGQAFGGGIRIRALLLSADGRRVVRGERQGVREDVGGVARDLAKLLIARGAHRLLESSTN